MFTKKFILTIIALLSLNIAVYPDITISFVGDMMLGSDYPNKSSLPPNEGKNTFTSVLDILKTSDITFGNLESSIADTTTKTRKKGKNSYAFRMPPYLANRLSEAGFDVLSVANNHARDFGTAGFNQTVQHVTNAKMKTVGEKIDKATFIEKSGKKIGFLAFYYFSYANNSIQDITKAKALVEKTKLECDYLIVTYHGGAEGDKMYRVPKKTETYFGENRGDVYKFAHAVSDAGADLVIGHGPHVLRAMEVYNDTLIAYSLGNFVGYRLFSTSGNKGIGAILTITLDNDLKLKSAQVTSVKLQNGGVPITDTNNTAVKKLNEYANLDFPKTGLKFDENGNIDF